MIRESYQYKTREEAEDGAVRYMNRYPYQGYSTSTTIRQDGARWLVHCSRLHSCD
jgi:hypothetical protein